MLGLGLTVREVLAIREGLPVYQVLRQLIAFFVGNGFSILPASELEPLLAFETLRLRMESNANNQVVLQYRPEGTYLTCTFQMMVAGDPVTGVYSLGENSLGKPDALAATTKFWKMGRIGFDIVGRDLPYDFALSVFINRISRKYFTPK